jgi:hypothetical protein
VTVGVVGARNLDEMSYREVKMLAEEHQARKRALRGEKGSVWPEWRGKGGAAGLEGFGVDGKSLPVQRRTGGEAVCEKEVVSII